jgi:hypothetical protein
LESVILVANKIFGARTADETQYDFLDQGEICSFIPSACQFEKPSVEIKAQPGQESDHK